MQRPFWLREALVARVFISHAGTDTGRAEQIHQWLKEDGHNAFFDLQFLNAAVERTGIKRNPFHPFSSFDTATLGGIAFGQTVLGRAVTAAGLSWEENRAHSALYDAEITARLFCAVVNRFRPFFEGA